MWEKKGELVAHEALYVYDKQMKEYFSRFKFQGDYHLAAVFSRELKQVLKKYKDYTIVPVPVSEERYQERGFNQVTALLEFAGLPYQNLVLKKDSKKQSSKTKQEHLAGQQIFRLRKNQALPSKILIVDDIYTTGSTIALMKTLFTEKNVKKIKSFSLSR
ncbi:ComF family protein [Streptococcus sp.]|nr:ComF family protein [Streptococcus sp.]